MIEFLTANPQLLLFVHTLVQAIGRLLIVTNIFAPLEALLAEQRAKFSYPGFASAAIKRGSLARDEKTAAL